MSRRPQRVALVHLGCAKNLVDSEHMLGRLAASGRELTADPDQADVLVVNTCAFIGPAKQESIDRILEGERWKAGREGRRLVVAGCLAERYAADLKREIPGIDAVVGTGQIDRILSAVEPMDKLELPGARRPEHLPRHTDPRLLQTPPHTAYLKISEGCDHSCSFCIIPTLRGAHRSRPVADLTAEARGLAALGVRELNLVAQDSTAYGRDRQPAESLGQLCRALHEVEGIEWIRVHYAYPTTLGGDFIEALAELPRLVPYLDIPLQHASRPVLQAMRRGGDGASHLRLLERVRRRVPGLVVRSTFIVGFPNETERRFEELLGFLETAQLDRVGAFSYSHEEGTEAGELRDRVPERVKLERLERLMQLQQAISRQRLARLAGTRQTVMVDEQRPDGSLLARLPTQALEVDGQVLVEAASAPPGSMIEVEVTKTGDHDVEARAVAA